MLGSFLDDLLRRAVRALDRAQVTYALCGGVALVMAGRDRDTRDLDVVADMDAAGLARLKAALREEGFSHHDRADRHRLEGVTLYRFWLPVRSTGLSASFDVQQAEDAFHRAVVEHAVTSRVRDAAIRVARVEDLVLLKLAAWRPIDRADAIELLSLHGGGMDLDRVRDWAARLGIEDRLRDAEASAGL